mmetsp:Transcript_29396/g.91431  ORF Transcript_29396/g.91431 Transcript_29396/m.91431 type:complete len:201 (-) Transcript_29396:461-1063(-)
MGTGAIALRGGARAARRRGPAGGAHELARWPRTAAALRSSDKGSRSSPASKPKWKGPPWSDASAELPQRALAPASGPSLPPQALQKKASNSAGRTPKASRKSASTPAARSRSASSRRPAKPQRSQSGPAPASTGNVSSANPLQQRSGRGQPGSAAGGKALSASRRVGQRASTTAPSMSAQPQQRKRMSQSLKKLRQTFSV